MQITTTVIVNMAIPLSTFSDSFLFDVRTVLIGLIPLLVSDKAEKLFRLILFCCL